MTKAKANVWGFVIAGCIILYILFLGGLTYLPFNFIGDLSSKLFSSNEVESDFYAIFFSGLNWLMLSLAMGFALVVALIYYFVICNRLFIFAKRWVWFVVLLLVLATPFASTLSTNHYAYAEEVRQVVIDGYKNSDIDGDTQKAIYSTVDYCAQRLNPESYMFDGSLRMQFAVTNAIFAGIMFFGFSIWFKRFTTHGKAIPF